MMENDARVVERQSSLDEALDALRRSPLPTLPIFDSETGRMVAVLARPEAIPLPAPPRLGGMATPLGVYLHDGISSGGAGFWGLFLTGVTMSLIALTAQTAAHGLSLAVAAHPAWIFQWQQAPPGLRQWLTALSPWLPLPLVFGLLRLVPLSGTHAAEHQVVHCIERRAPLLPDCVREMPRVHPRCGTNLLAGFTLFLLAFVSVFGAAQASGWPPLDGASLGAMLAAPLALYGWRRVGGWVQQWCVTRPATEKQIAGGIRAAEQVLSRRSLRLERSSEPRFAGPRRLWTMGLVQVLLGYCVVLGLLTLAGVIWPALSGWLEA